MGSLGSTFPTVLLSMGVSTAALSKTVCVARRQAENAVKRRSHQFALTCGIGSPPSSDSVVWPVTEKGDLEPSDLVCTRTVVTLYDWDQKTDLLHLFLYLHLPCLLLLSEALTFAVLF